MDYFLTSGAGGEDDSLKYDRKRHNKSTVDNPGLYSRAGANAFTGTQMTSDSNFNLTGGSHSKRKSHYSNSKARLSQLRRSCLE